MGVEDDFYTIQQIKVLSRHPRKIPGLSHFEHFLIFFYSNLLVKKSLFQSLCFSCILWPVSIWTKKLLITCLKKGWPLGKNMTKKLRYVFLYFNILYFISKNFLKPKKFSNPHKIFGPSKNFATLENFLDRKYISAFKFFSIQKFCRVENYFRVKNNF